MLRTPGPIQGGPPPTRREAAGLHHNGRSALRDEGLGCCRVGERLVLCGGDVVLAASKRGEDRGRRWGERGWSAAGQALCLLVDAPSGGSGLQGPTRLFQLKCPLLCTSLVSLAKVSGGKLQTFLPLQGKRPSPAQVLHKGFGALQLRGGSGRPKCGDARSRQAVHLCVGRRTSCKF